MFSIIPTIILTLNYKIQIYCEIFMASQNPALENAAYAKISPTHLIFHFHIVLGFTFDISVTMSVCFSYSSGIKYDIFALKEEIFRIYIFRFPSLSYTRFHVSS